MAGGAAERRLAFSDPIFHYRRKRGAQPRRARFFGGVTRAILRVAGPATAGREPLIDPVVHPELLLGPRDHLETCAAIIESGALPFRWYPTALMRAALAKLGRTVRRG